MSVALHFENIEMEENDGTIYDDIDNPPPQQQGDGVYNNVDNPPPQGQRPHNVPQPVTPDRKCSSKLPVFAVGLLGLLLLAGITVGVHMSVKVSRTEMEEALLAQLSHLEMRINTTEMRLNTTESELQEIKGKNAAGSSKEDQKSTADTCAADTCVAVRPCDNAKNIKSLGSTMDKKLSELQAVTNASLTRLQTAQDSLIGQNAVVPKVAFSASLADRSEVHLGPAASQTILFKNVFFNNGNAYNSTTGYFTASHKGAYLFTFTTHSGSTSYNSGAKLVKNGEVQVSTWERQEDAGTMSGAVILSLNATDTVNVITRGDGYQLYDSHNHYTTFSGFLLFPL